jgi:hypothetical protein
VLFVCRAESSESSRAAEALASLDNVEVVITSPDKLNHDHGSLDLIVTAQETLLESVALANEALGLSGMSAETVRRTLNKSQFKATLKSASINTPGYQAVGKSGFPIVLKSVFGSGALATLVLRSEEDLKRALEWNTDLADFIVEEYIEGQELCIDTITIDNEPQFYSICCYYPSILEAVERPEMQWRCVMPREIEGEVYREFINQGLQATRALRHTWRDSSTPLDVRGLPTPPSAPQAHASRRCLLTLTTWIHIAPGRELRLTVVLMVHGNAIMQWERSFFAGSDRALSKT